MFNQGGSNSSTHLKVGGFLASLYDWMSDNDICSCFDSKFQRAFQNSEYFITNTKAELFSDIYVTAIKPGSGRFTVEEGWPFDDDYVDFVVGPRGG
jgi:hypothetical protein